MPQNAGDIARKFIKDPELLSFIDAEVGWHYPFPRLKIFLIQKLLGSKYHMLISQEEIYSCRLQCFIVSTVNALQTPMINASMVICLIFASWPPSLCSFSVFFIYCFLRFFVTGILGESTTLLAGLVELPSP